jgi:glycosyltransferase involved in cell wall biosynthesis
MVKDGFGRPDLVHLHVVHPAGYAALALKLFTGIPYVLTEHCDLALRISRGLQRIGPISRWLMRLVMDQAVKVMVDSTAMRQALCAEGFRDDAVVIANIVEPVSDTAIRRRKDNGFRLVHVSSLWDRQKNVSGLLHALVAAVKQLVPEKIVLDIIGDGPDREILQSLAGELGLLGKEVRFHGQLDEVNKKKLLLQADCFILSSRFEGFSVATAEALSAGLPVIVTDCGGPRDFVNEENGITVPPDDHLALSQAIVRMCRERDKYSRLAIQKQAQKAFDSESLINATLAIYDQVPVRWTAGLSWERIEVNPEWLVLDVGSGHNPNGRADILLDRGLEPSEHRTGQRTVIPTGRGMVIGDATAMPFINGAFDYAIASHIAEHVEQVEALMSELQRVAQRGYLETPGLLTEYISNVPYHRWLVRKTIDGIVFERKKIFRVPNPLLFAFFNLNDSIDGRKTYKSHNSFLMAVHRSITRVWKFLPSAYTKYHWQGNIKYQVRR